MSQTSYPLITHLINLEHRGDRGALAEIRRGLGKAPGAAPSMFPHVAPFVPAAAARAAEDGPYYLVAALFAAHPHHTDRHRSLAAAFRSLGHGAQEGTTGSHELRFRALLKASTESLPHHLRSAVGMLRKDQVTVNFHELLQHLIHWNHPEGWVQRRWALDFWASTELPVNAARTDESSTSDGA